MLASLFQLKVIAGNRDVEVGVRFSAHWSTGSQVSEMPKHQHLLGKGMIVWFCIFATAQLYTRESRSSREWKTFLIYIHSLLGRYRLILGFYLEIVLKHKGAKKAKKGNMMVCPNSLYVTSCNQQMMPLNLYSRNESITYGLSSSCQQTFVALLSFALSTENYQSIAYIVLGKHSSLQNSVQLQKTQPNFMMVLHALNTK